MTYLLDTNALSALMRGDAVIVGRLSQIEKSEVSIPQPVIAEIEYGLARMPRSRRKALLQTRFEAIRSELGRAVWSDDVSLRFGEVKAMLEKAGTRLEDFDLAIAAHALAVDAVLVTADRDHMERIRGLRVEQWTG